MEEEGERDEQKGKKSAKSRRRILRNGDENTYLLLFMFLSLYSYNTVPVHAKLAMEARCKSHFYIDSADRIWYAGDSGL
jgi:hypothetical protein